MTQQETAKQGALRTAFDKAYGFDFRRHLASPVRQFIITARSPRYARRTGIFLIVVGTILLSLVLSEGLERLARAIVYHNRPAIETRLEPPLDLNARLMPQLDSKTVNLFPLWIEGYTYMGENVVTPLVQCLYNTLEPDIPGEDDRATGCDVAAIAIRTDRALYVSEVGDSIVVASAQYLTPEDTRETLMEYYRYARSVGGIGDYVLGRTQPVAYFYARVRDLNYLTWSYGNWIFTVGASDTDTAEAFVKQFPH